MSDVNPKSHSCLFCDTIVVDKVDYIVTNVTTGSTIREANSPLIQIFNFKNHQGCSRATLVSMNVLRMTSLSFILKLKELLKKNNDSLLAFIMPNSPPPIYPARPL